MTLNSAFRWASQCVFIGSAFDDIVTNEYPSLKEPQLNRCSEGRGWGCFNKYQCDIILDVGVMAAIRTRQAKYNADCSVRSLPGGTIKVMGGGWMMQGSDYTDKCTSFLVYEPHTFTHRHKCVHACTRAYLGACMHIHTHVGLLPGCLLSCLPA